MGHKKQEGTAMKVILATRNRYLEYGLQALLTEHSVIGEISGEDLTQSKIMDTIAGGEKKNG